MDKENTISKAALKKVARLIQDVLDDRNTVAAVSQLVLSGALRAGLKVSPPAAQAIAILLLTIGRACAEQLSGENNLSKDCKKSFGESAKYPMGSHVPSSDEIH
jgi:hypothetical protein